MKIIKNFIVKIQTSFNYSMCVLLFIVFTLFFNVFYYSLQNTVDQFIIRAKIRIWLVESFINTSIEDAYHVMYGLSDRLKHESIKLGSQRVQKIVDSFDYELNFRRSISLCSLKVYDANDIVIYRSAEPAYLFASTKSVRNLALLTQIKVNSSNFQVGEVQPESSRSKEAVIPFCMAINNIDKKYMGGVCSGLIISKLNAQVNAKYSASRSSKVVILSKDSFNANYSIDKIITIRNLLKYCFLGEDFIIHFSSANYPIIIGLETNFYYLIKEIISNLIFSICYLALFCLFSYYSFILHRKFYQKPLEAIQQKLSVLLNDIPRTNGNVINAKELELVNNNQTNLLQSIDDVIDYCCSLHINAQKDALEASSIELREKLAHLILTEKHYTSSNVTNKFNIGPLYLEHLRKLIHEKYTTISLLKFFQDVVDYCCEYHHELNIKIIVNKKDCKDFTFKHAALTETIFHIFTLITRLGKFNLENEAIIIKGSFNNKSRLPTISIEAVLSDSSIRSLGWISGPTYVYTGFISIYLLAKENNLQFYIEQKNQSVMFILEPTEIEQLEKVHNNYLNLI